ncbi:Holliday junction DNA helicase subunit RuvA [Keratinibaculum paraultunense]|uniref:Holliday junction branch migration complex subunit RuvA n=2 Tax=Keratinibaculum paraultunense TaxID=1278232 RepID=A0A4R3KW36_9FIRM|nr:Holliday junction branch migration protein RuvA [Keratinibaculum paraultunense]TCS89550.1 Holliday junction DNA helicase subunit RuvA [Keratinibaculum paraultunense]
MEIKEDYIVLENNGIGYRVFTSKHSINNLSINQTITMYIYFNLREDGVYLYGFTTEEELNMFNKLLLVSKIGPKVGLNILSTLTPNEIKSAIINKDTDILCNAPGVGEKTAGRIILELKDRIDATDVDTIEDVEILNDNSDINIAINGLISLGYTRKEIDWALNKLDISSMDTEDIIKEVLRRLSR